MRRLAWQAAPVGTKLGARTATLSGGVPAVAALIGVAFMGSTLVTPLYALYRREFGFSEITLTLVYAIYVVGNLAALLFFGRLSDIVGRRGLAFVALAFAGISTLLFLFASGTPWLYIARAVIGFSIGLASGTGAAWLAELLSNDRSRAALLATASNGVGIAIGPLIAGVLAHYSSAPLHLPYIVYLVLLLATAILLTRAPETVHARQERPSIEWFLPRLGVPRDVGGQFFAPAATAFSMFALIGFYSALIPTVLSEDLHRSSPLIAGAVVFELFAVMTVVLIATRDMPSRAGMRGDLIALLPSAALLLAAQFTHSFLLLNLASVACGIAAGLGYRATLQVVIELSPDDRRAEVASTYYVCCFIGNSIPVIGVGLIASVSSSFTASVILACTIAAFAIAALVASRTAPKRQMRKS